MTNNTWPQQPLSEITELIKDGTHGTHKNTSDGLPLLSAKDINNGHITTDNNPRLISNSDYQAIHRNYEIQINDVLLTVVGTIGRTAIVKDLSRKFTIQRSVAVLRMKDQVLPEYCYQFIQSDQFQRDLTQGAHGLAQAGIYLTELGKKRIPVPPLKVQQKIVDIFSSLDEAIQKTSHIIQKKQELKRGLLGQLTSDISGQSMRLGDVIKIKNGFAYSGKNMVDEETNTILLTPGNVEIGGGFNCSKLRYYSGEVIRNYELKQGDVFVALTDLTPQANFLGYPAIVPDLKKTFLHNQRLGFIQPLSSKVHLMFIYFLLMTSSYRQHVVSTATGTTVKHTSVSKILDFKFNLPNIDAQKSLSERLETIENDLKIEKKTKDRYLELKKGLMQDIFNQKTQIN